jgi:hypothetical protein
LDPKLWLEEFILRNLGINRCHRNAPLASRPALRRGRQHEFQTEFESFKDPPGGFEANADYSAWVAGSPNKVTAEVLRVPHIGSRPMDHLSKRNALNILFVFSFFGAFVALLVRFG